MNARRWFVLVFSVSMPVAAADLETQARDILGGAAWAVMGRNRESRARSIYQRKGLEGREARAPHSRPARSNESLLMTRVDKGEMPPSAPLPPEEKESLRRWIDAGAAWSEAIAERRAGRDWWSLQPLQSFTAPSSVDHWISAALNAERVAAVARGGPAHLDSPPDFRFDRPATLAGRSRRFLT